MTTPPVLIEEQWELLRQFLPRELDEHARAHGAMRRKRGAISSGEQLLRVLLMHVAGGLSLQQTVVRAKQRGLADLNAMALHKRLCNAGPWLRSLTSHVLATIKPMLGQQDPSFAAGRRVRILDATTVSEPGSTGTDWRVHYSLRLPDLCCDFFELTDASGAETVNRLDLESGDLVLLDRAYNHRQAISKLLAAKADIILRYNSGAFPLTDEAGNTLNLLPKLQKLRIGEIGEWSAWFKDRSGQRLSLRVCVVRKSEEATKRSERKVVRKARGNVEGAQQKTLEYTKFLVVLTSVPVEEMHATVVLEFYRARWQVEMAFKRLKTLLELGQLPKKNPRSSLAWMQGKILCSLIIERILCEAQFVSPWGYPTGWTQQMGTLQGGT
jgi:Transposase DDE domain